MCMAELRPGVVARAHDRLAGIDAVVAQSASQATAGPPCFDSLQAALDAAPVDGPYRILIRAGHYREKLIITRPHVALVGEGAERTVIHCDKIADDLSPLGLPLGTAGSGTVIVRATDFQAYALSIRNDFDYAANSQLPVGHPRRRANPQGVALMLDAGADRCLLQDVHVLGQQDSLYVEGGRSLFRHCLIGGHVDFILGGGRAVFDACELRTRHRTPPAGEPLGWLTAACTPRAQAQGFLFLGCRLTREEGVPEGSTMLGRPWHPTTSFADGRYADPDAIACVSFVDCWMDAHVCAQGWDAMGGFDREGRRVMFSPRDARFGELRSSGPGARGCDARPPLDACAAQPAAVLGDWLPPFA